MRHIHIPIFVPHLGCPHACVFCNQRTITGQNAFSLENAKATIDQVLSTVPKDAHKEIAFFGGSFTAINRELMLILLALGKSYIDQWLVSSIRLSTRPDAINDEILALLKAYGVETIELGIQSTDPAVLDLTERGHSVKDAKNACKLVKAYGFTLVGQMMLGLPASTLDKELKTAENMTLWGIDEARIYPTVVFPDTALAAMMREGSYTPLSIEEAAERGGILLDYFDKHRIPVIRVGLCESEGLRHEERLAGAYHPALGELCQSAFFRRRIEEQLTTLSLPAHAEITVEVSASSLSQAIGQKKSNLTYFEKTYPDHTFFFKPSFALGKKDVKIHTKEN